MKRICHKYGVLLILDEVMCGMGRTGFLHAWQEENVVPDVQIVGKGLAGGYANISAVLFGHKLVNAFEHGPGNGAFAHGHTFQNFPLACATGLAVQKIVRDEGLVANVREKGALLRQKLEMRLSSHRYVGNIRGKGHFQGVSLLSLVNLLSLTCSSWNSCKIKKPKNRSIRCTILPGNSTREVRAAMPSGLPILT
jgi:adenosylmethionine-8-amino-7-oxononanoate aminotransferase